MLQNQKINFEPVGGIMLIEAEADGRKGFFAFDTGSGRTVINRRYYECSDSCQQDASIYSGRIRSRKAASGNIRRLAFAGITLTDLPVWFLDLSYVEDSLRTLRSGLIFLGTIGMDFISRFRVRIDYETHSITLNPAEPFSESRFAAFESVHSMIVVSGSIGSRKCSFLLDTGANTCLISNELCGCEQIRDSGQALTPLLLTELTLGQQTCHDIAAVSGNVREIKNLTVDAVIGFQILSKQRTDIDFNEHKIFFELKKDENSK